MFGFACLWTVPTFTMTYADYSHAIGVLTDGPYDLEEGPVRNFIPMPYAGHYFSYSDYVVTAGFHQSASHGGPIREGLRVRIAYTGDMILRLEVAA